MTIPPDPPSPAALYDDPGFFAAYDAMRAQDGRLNELVEEPAMWSLLPPLPGRVVADLGCGAGAMCRRMLAAGAASVDGYEAAARMLALARAAAPAHSSLRYHQADLESLDFAPGTLDLVVSSLALHYVHGFDALAARVASGLRAGGSFVFSVEHPIVTCDTRDWTHAADGTRLHWPVDRYLDQGPRAVRWLGRDDVPRVHRTVAGYLAGLLRAGLHIGDLREPGPDATAIARWPRLADQRRRPPFLVVRADKP